MGHTIPITTSPVISLRRRLRDLCQMRVDSRHNGTKLNSWWSIRKLPASQHLETATEAFHSAFHLLYRRNMRARWPAGSISDSGMQTSSLFVTQISAESVLGFPTIHEFRSAYLDGQRLSCNLLEIFRHFCHHGCQSCLLIARLIPVGLHFRSASGFTAE